MSDTLPWSITAAEALEILRGRRGGGSEEQVRAVARLIAERHPEVVKLSAPDLVVLPRGIFD